MYDETNRDNVEKLNYSIAANFNGSLTTISAALQDVARTVPLVEMLDFGQASFEKQIGLTVKKELRLSARWPNMTIGDLCNMKAGGTPARSEPAYWGGDVKWLKISDFRDFDLIKDTEERITQAGLDNSSAKLLLPETVVVTIFATIGRVGILANPMATNQAIVGLIPKSPEIVKPYYLMHAIKHCVDQLLAAAAGLAQDNINQKKLAALKIPVPSPAVQDQIISECRTVDNELNRAKILIDRLTNDTNNEIATIYSSTALHSEIDKLASSIQYGLNEAMNEGGVGYKIFRMNEIIRGRMVDNGKMKCADISAEEFAKYKLNKGDLLFNRTNSIEHVGKTGLFDLDGDYCFASYLVRVVPDTGRVQPKFLEKMMNSSAFQTEAKGKASKSINQANINATVMRNIKVPVPSLAEQKKFVAKIEALEKQIAEAQALIDGAAARKQAILQKYL